MVKIALNLRAVLSCERDQTCSIRAPPVRPFALSLNISLARSPAVSLTSLRLRWVDDPRGMSRSTPSMTARLFFYLFLFITYCTEIRSLPVLADRPTAACPACRASCLACSVMVVIAAPMYNIIIVIIITRSYGVHIIIVAIGVRAVVVRAGGAFLPDLLLTFTEHSFVPSKNLAIFHFFFFLIRGDSPTEQ